MWLRDFLPHQIERARVVTYGYNSALMGPNTSVSSVKDFACDLLHRILDDRKSDKVCNYQYVFRLSNICKDKSRPLMFICHSLGGIVVKQVGTFHHGCILGLKLCPTGNRLRPCRSKALSRCNGSHTICNIPCNSTWGEQECEYWVSVVKRCRNGIPETFETAPRGSQASITHPS